MHKVYIITVEKKWKTSQDMTINSLLNKQAGLMKNEKNFFTSLCEINHK